MRVGPTLERLQREYDQDLRIVYKMHPLPSHSFAKAAAQAALAAQQQGKFFEMHELLMQRYRDYASLGAAKASALGSSAGAGDPQIQAAVFADFAAELGLDVDRFKADYGSGTLLSRIDAETREVVAIGATGTPASFVNGRFISGAAPYETFKSLVDEMLQAGGGASAAASP